MTVDITHDCIWILNADKHLCILQSKHLQCIEAIAPKLSEKADDPPSPTGPE